MQEATESRSVPVHLWIVGVLLTLWNGFGCYDYLMTRTKGAAYINEMMHTTDGDAAIAMRLPLSRCRPQARSSALATSCLTPRASRK